MNCSYSTDIGTAIYNEEEEECVGGNESDKLLQWDFWDRIVEYSSIENKIPEIHLDPIELEFLPFAI